jgi:kynurenine 3-monooxygenase
MFPFFENNDDELRKYFTRRTYRGAVVQVSALNHGEWIVLLGDAAHSVLPPTGEGINSGLEDTEVLIDALLLAVGITPNAAASAAPAAALTATTPWFARYNSARLHDLQGLGKLAHYLNEQNNATGAQFAAGLGFTICQSILKNMGVFSWTYEDLTFGPRAVERKPYGEIISVWEGRKNVILPMCQGCCFSCLFLWNVLSAPCWMTSYVMRALSRK